MTMCGSTGPSLNAERPPRRPAPRSRVREDSQRNLALRTLLTVLAPQNSRWPPNAPNIHEHPPAVTAKITHTLSAPRCVSALSADRSLRGRAQPLVRPPILSCNPTIGDRHITLDPAAPATLLCCFSGLSMAPVPLINFLDRPLHRSTATRSLGSSKFDCAIHIPMGKGVLFDRRAAYHEHLRSCGRHSPAPGHSQQLLHPLRRRNPL
ncbi:hypothetical protein K458DRAFT_159060 [Lentithecium fluviatile CBS 122367]|uniref:Uncharacterized protein n=1 Tax=Lentithecium fluviatile CBS 122367 TaxID=1168545 RepID=A0A6G1IH58_9PLEO|nr:hypothetical protein K458DRAFT_159060 [Lentithecium fluviatile CBS 122367]